MEITIRPPKTLEKQIRLSDYVNDQSLLVYANDIGMQAYVQNVDAYNYFIRQDIELRQFIATDKNVCQKQKPCDDPNNVVFDGFKLFSSDMFATWIVNSGVKLKFTRDGDCLLFAGQDSSKLIKTLEDLQHLNLKFKKQ